jgi:hypothetical protein
MAALPPALPFPLSVGLRPAWHVGWAMLLGLVRPEKGPNRPCLGRWPGMTPASARLAWHGVPCRPDSLRAVPGTGPCRAGPDQPVDHLY